MNGSEILLDTPRLLLRHVTIDDAAAFFAYASDDEVGRNAGWRPHESIEETKNIINNYFLGKDLAFGIILKESGKFIGTIGLTQNPLRIIKGSLELGYSLNKDYWNQGIMTEAVNAIIDYGFNAANLEEHHSKLLPAQCQFTKGNSEMRLQFSGDTSKGRDTLRRSCHGHGMLPNDAQRMGMEKTA
jgi:RimJ/RimL family protein N-acetyltransferase